MAEDRYTFALRLLGQADDLDRKTPASGVPWQGSCWLFRGVKLLAEADPDIPAWELFRRLSEAMPNMTRVVEDYERTT